MKFNMILGIFIIISCDIFGQQGSSAKLSFLKAPRQKIARQDLKQFVATHENNSTLSSSQSGIVAVDSLRQGDKLEENQGLKLINKFHSPATNILVSPVKTAQPVKSPFKPNQSVDPFKSSERNLSLLVQDSNNQSLFGVEGIYLNNSHEPAVVGQNPLSLRQDQAIPARAKSDTENSVSPKSVHEQKNEEVYFYYNSIFPEKSQTEIAHSKQADAIEIAESKRVTVPLLKSQSPQELFNKVGITLQELVKSLSNMSMRGWQKVLQYLHGQPKTAVTLEAIKEIEGVVNPMLDNESGSSGKQSSLSKINTIQLKQALVKLPSSVSQRLDKIARADQIEQAKEKSGSQASSVNNQRDKDVRQLVSQPVNVKLRDRRTVVSAQENFASNRPVEANANIVTPKAQSFKLKKEIAVVNDPVVYASLQPEVIAAKAVPTVKNGNEVSSIEYIKDEPNKKLRIQPIFAEQSTNISLPSKRHSFAIQGNISGINPMMESNHNQNKSLDVTAVSQEPSLVKDRIKYWNALTEKSDQAKQNNIDVQSQVKPLSKKSFLKKQDSTILGFENTHENTALSSPSEIVGMNPMKNNDGKVEFKDSSEIWVDRSL